MNTEVGSYTGDPALASVVPGASLQGFSRTRNGRRYQLVIVQQPSRARMCGFGDKDRRPLSPTLIAKLVIYDVATGVELHPSEVNTSLFFVTSDLCHPDDLMGGPRNILVNPGGSAIGFPGPSSSGGAQPASPSVMNESMMSGGGGAGRGDLPVATPSNHAHFDPHTQSHVFASDLASHSYSHMPAHEPSWNTSDHHMGPSSASGGGFLPASSSSSYGAVPEMSGADGTGLETGAPHNAATYPVAMGMAGAYTVGDHPPPLPPHSGMPGSGGPIGPGAAVSGSGPMMGGYDYAPLPPPLGSAPPYPYAQAHVPAYGSGGGISGPAQPAASNPYAPPISSSSSTGLSPTTPLSSASLTHSLSSDNLTRNLVGSAVASANVLKDMDEKVCIFFVLQDISVRTEGVYRIKLMFADLGLNGTVNRGISEALAETYTDAFVVYSPRKFPGMHDPTELSRKLVAQGVKIPVRSDRKKQGRGGGGGHGGGGGDGGGAGPSSGAHAGDDDDGDDD
ncbi:unnamed protein product [Tilletia controversa]|nr:hypothetical protein CF335_g6196 [Tilletia laevis]CAD6920944.1 unnamed protein product [Tilletia caries]CAD6966697.1 unnamed protein product [Tilletia controversa]CAD7061445.1 unnamed protein product [Tilletia caries]